MLPTRLDEDYDHSIVAGQIAAGRSQLTNQIWREKMSIRSLTTLAVARDTADHGDPALSGNAGAGDGRKEQSFLDVLTSAIPTEPLAGYTALVAIVAAAKSHNQFLALRWWVYAVFLAIVIASVQVSYSARKAKPLPKGGVSAGRQRTVPVAEILSATIAAAAWGLVSPGSGLQVMLKGDTATITMACITIGGAALVTLITPTLRGGSNTPKPVAAVPKPA